MHITVRADKANAERARAKFGHATGEDKGSQ
jgi:hypothetical protein